MRAFYRNLLFFVALVAPCSLKAQQNLVYSHYFLNPFLYNPSFVAQAGYTELFLNYRNQWTGIDGAPVTGTVSLHLPLNYKTGIALTAFQDKAGVLKTTTGMATFAYQVYLGNSVNDDHKIAFGLSAGVTSVSINADNSYANEPVVGATSSFEGQFGMHYQRKNFKIAFAIPRLFNTYVASDQDFNKVSLRQVRTTLSSVSYNIQFNERIAFEPMALYRTYENTSSQFEGLGVLRIDNIAWVGGSYRQSYGATAFAGINIKDKFKVGYAYEFAPAQASALGNGTHEMQLIVRLGKKKFSKSQVKNNTEPQQPLALENNATSAEDNGEEIKEQEKEIQEKEIQEKEKQVISSGESSWQAESLEREPEKSQSEQIVSTHAAANIPNAATDQKEAVKSINGDRLQPGHYVVVGAFRSVENAKSYARTLRRANYPAEVAYQPEKLYYIVHMNNAATIEEARQLRNKYRQMSRYTFRDTWILSIE